MALVFPLMLFINTGFLFLLIFTTFFHSVGVDYNWLMKVALLYMEVQIVATVFVLFGLCKQQLKWLYALWLFVLLILCIDGYWPFLMNHQWLLYGWCAILVYALVCSMRQFPYSVASRLMFSILFYAIVLIMTWLTIHRHDWLSFLLNSRAAYQVYFAFSRYLELAATTTFFYSFFLLRVIKTQDSPKLRRMN